MITSPYNFVPLNNKVYIPDWWDKVYHDIPFSDGETGWIDVVFKNLSPLFVRDGEQKEYSAHIKTDKNGKLYFIPATTIKGMLRATMEILSFAKMQQYEDRFFGYRELGKDYASGAEYPKMMENVKSGWLKKDGEKFVIYPCAETYIPIALEKILERFPKLEEKKSSWKRNNYIKQALHSETMYPYIEIDGVKGRIVCTGKMDGKKHEFLFSRTTNDKKKIVLTERDKLKFITVHAPSDNFKDYESLLDKRKEVAVFYLETNNEEDAVQAVGLSKMIRYPYKYSVKDLVDGQQSIPEKGRDLCETIWGTTEKESLRGRVQISHAFCDASISEKELKKAEGIQGMPKASYYPLYLTQNKAPYKDYNTAETISGRKRYRTHKSNMTVDLPKSRNPRFNIIFNALPSGETFRFRINLHNMRKIEIGALLSSLTFHDTKGCYHNIGLAKSQGYGKIQCEEITLNGLQFEKEEYLSAFEKEMNTFTEQYEDSKWSDSPQIRMLTAIAREHEQRELKLMGLEEYKASKKRFETISENERDVISMADLEQKRKELENKFVLFKSLLNDEKFPEAKTFFEENPEITDHEEFENAYAILISAEKKEEKFLQEAKELEQKGEYSLAIDKYKEAEKIFNNRYCELISVCEKNLQKENYKRKINNAKNLIAEGKFEEAFEIAQKIIEQYPDSPEAKEIIADYNRNQDILRNRKKEEEEQKEKIAKGLGAFLDEKYEFGVNAGKHKVNNVKLCLDKTNQWLKKVKREELNEQEKNELIETLRRIRSYNDKKEAKDWQNYDSGKIWPAIKKLINNEIVTKSFFEE